MTDITARQPSADKRSGPLRAAGRYLVGVSAVAIASGLVLTGTAAGSAAPTLGGSDHPARAITLTGNTSSSAGQLSVRFSYRPGEGGAVKPLSLTFSGGSPLKIAHPAVVFSLRSVPGLVHGKPVQVKSRPVITVVVRIRDVHHFSGKLPVKDLLRIGLRFGKPGRQVRSAPTVVIAASVASVSQKRPVSISAPVGLQVGILLGPIAFANVH
ncbi:MAG TPA: hypothetical protein VFI65_19730 [Streptosporangiaceae bacterium]|nr:hypothetical protein [Streptosporangiaceae bacterium]